MHFWATMEVDHVVQCNPCWLITLLMDQFYNTRNLGDLSPADRLWLFKVVKSLHNGFKNAMMVDTSSNQWHIWLTLLFAMGSPCTTSAPTQPPRNFNLSNRASLAWRSTATGPAR